MVCAVLSAFRKNMASALTTQYAKFYPQHAPHHYLSNLNVPNMVRLTKSMMNKSHILNCIAVLIVDSQI